jgi:hypothetical protein
LEVVLDYFSKFGKLKRCFATRKRPRLGCVAEFADEKITESVTKKPHKLGEKELLLKPFNAMGCGIVSRDTSSAVKREKVMS